MDALTQFLHDAFTLPTSIFSVLLILAALYWGVKLAGIFDLEMFEAMGDVAEAVGDGADALADGADALDAADAIDGLDDTPGFFDKFGFGDVPRSITWSLAIFFGWGLSFAGNHYFPQLREFAVRGLWVTGVIFAATLAGGAVLAAIAVQPLRRLMDAVPGTARRDLIGRVCTVRTLKVDDGFGQAEVDDGSMLVQVRTQDPAVSFTRGDKALIFHYDPAREVFLVAPYDPMESAGSA